jgi:hypothetical protein
LRYIVLFLVGMLGVVMLELTYTEVREPANSAYDGAAHVVDAFADRFRQRDAVR